MSDIAQVLNEVKNYPNPVFGLMFSKTGWRLPGPSAPGWPLGLE